MKNLPMLKEQLSAVKRSRKTLLYNKKAVITFITDDALDNYTILGNISLKTPYTTQKALHFERHSLSEKEEYRFNTKFSAFLSGLVPHMKNANIDYLLEFLQRVYFLSTYNAEELLFLLLPFKKYSEQISIIAANGPPLFRDLRKYSAVSIARAIVGHPRNFFHFVRYFKNYALLREFLDRVLNCVIETIRNGRNEYCSEIYQISVHLINEGHHAEALRIFHRLKSYLDSEEFVKILLPYYDEALIRMKHVQDEVLDEFATIHRNQSGRSLLSDETRLRQYMLYLDKMNKTPAEFTVEEYQLLKMALLPGTADVNVLALSSIDCYDRVFRESGFQVKLTGLLCEHSQFRRLLQWLTTESKLFYLASSGATIDDNINGALGIQHILEMLTDENHGLLLRNISKNVLKRYYKEILFRCLTFKSFEASIFDAFIFCDSSEDIVNQNIVRLAVQTDYPLHTLLNEDQRGDSVFLSYLLTSAHWSPCDGQIDVLLAHVKTLRKPSLVADAASFLLRCGSCSSSIIEFTCWAISGGFASGVESLVVKYAEKLAYDTLWDFTMEMANDSIIQLLYDRDQSTLSRLYDARKYYLVHRLSVSVPNVSGLIEHPFVFEYISGYYDKIADKESLVRFLLDHIESPKSVRLILRDLDILIRFRYHVQWPAIKMILIEGLEDTRAHKTLLSYILSHIQLFSNDRDLFEAVLSGNVSVSQGDIEKISQAGEPAAEIIEEMLLKKLIDPLPLIPCIAPLLIRHRKGVVASLFMAYPNLMGTYSRNILVEYPEKLSVLVHVDSRRSLDAALYVLVADKMPISDHERILELVERILKLQDCTSLSTMNKLSVFLAGLEPCPSSILRAFVDCFSRSFPHTYSSCVESLVSHIHSSRGSELLWAIAEGNLQKNAEIFCKAFATVLRQLTAGDSGALRFFAEYLKYSSASDCHIHDPLPLALIIFDMQDTWSPLALSGLCNLQPSIVSNLNDSLMSKLHILDWMEYSLAVLEHLFVSSESYRANESEIVSTVMPLTEHKNRNVAARAQSLYQAIQSHRPR